MNTLTRVKVLISVNTVTRHSKPEACVLFMKEFTLVKSHISVVSVTKNLNIMPPVAATNNHMVKSSRFAASFVTKDL